jgi:hypothetical protein
MQAIAPTADQAPLVREIGPEEVVRSECSALSASRAIRRS